MKLHHPLVFLLSLQVNALPSTGATNARSAIAARYASSFASEKYIFADALSNTLSGVEIDGKQQEAMQRLTEMSMDLLSEPDSVMSDQVLDDLMRLEEHAGNGSNGLAKRDKNVPPLLLPIMTVGIIGGVIGGLFTGAEIKHQKEKKKKKQEKEEH